MNFGITMKERDLHMRLGVFLFIALIVGTASCTQAESLLLCGRKSVHLARVTTATEGQAGVDFLWDWTAEKSPEIPESMRAMFATTDECKPVGDGSRILITSSSQGCAVVEYPSGKTLWYAQVANAHSIELLPKDRLVVASSVSPQGNQLILFDMARSNQPLSSVPLPSGHGVVWDATRERLWALGSDELQCHTLENWDSNKPSLAIQDRYPLPDQDGHDLQPVPDSNDLMITTGKHVFLFDRETHQFRAHPELGPRGRVKSVSMHPETKRVVFVQSGEEQWWSHSMELLSPQQTITLPGHDLYKARWFPENPANP